MLTFLTYEIKVAVILAVFYLCYKLLLSRDTLHRLNRAVLVGTSVLSFVLPLCVLTFHKVVEVQAGEGLSMPALAGVLATDGTIVNEMETVVSKSSDWGMLLAWLYLAGVMAVLAGIAIGLVKVRRVIRFGEVRNWDGHEVVVTSEDVAPFSWIRWIVMSETDFLSGNRHILEHERAHVALRHSFDVLLVDTLSALQWFNPVIWLLKSDLRAVHESEADDAVLKGGANIKEYQYSLIRKAVSASGYSITNSFNHSILKNRITMMCRLKTSPFRGVKALYIVPLVCAALACNARTVTDYKVSNSSGVDNIEPAYELVFDFRKAESDDSQVVKNRAVNGTVIYYEGLPVSLTEARELVASSLAEGPVSLIFKGEIDNAVEYYRQVQKVLFRAVDGHDAEAWIDLKKNDVGDIVIFINDEQTDLDELGTKVGELLKIEKNGTVEISGEGDIRCGIVEDIKQVLREVGALNVRYSCTDAESSVTRCLPRDTGTLRENDLSGSDPMDVLETVSRERIHIVKVNSKDNVFFDVGPIEFDDIYESTLNIVRSDHKAIFSYQHDRGASFGMYLATTGQIVKAVDAVREEYAQQTYGRTLEQLTEDEYSNVLTEIPMGLSEAMARPF